MMIDEYQVGKKSDRLTEDKEIKVKIPLDYHIRLHTVKVVKGQNISATVKAALAHYFESLQEQRVLPPDTRDAPLLAPGIE
jgi:hypothetical protein